MSIWGLVNFGGLSRACGHKKRLPEIRTGAGSQEEDILGIGEIIVYLLLPRLLLHIIKDKRRKIIKYGISC